MNINFPVVPISSLQRTTKPMMENDIVCVMKNYKPAFYTIDPVRLDQLLRAEKKLMEIVSSNYE